MIRVLVVTTAPRSSPPQRRRFRRGGFELAGIARAGEEAVELARVIRPDIALIDFNMPGMTGEETAERLALESPETVTVVVSATPDARGRLNGRFDKRRRRSGPYGERTQDPDVPH